MLKLSGINYESIVDSEGVSTVLFFSGCRHNCDGCHNSAASDFNNGIEVSDKLINTINDNTSKRLFLNAIVLSGGDPMFSATDILSLLDKLYIPKNNIWIYSGFTYEEILEDEDRFNLLKRCNVLIDGRFEKDKRDTTLSYRGSSNQRVIDIQESIKCKEVKLYLN